MSRSTALFSLCTATRSAASYTLSLHDALPISFVDVRMPPGWDGIETILHIWKEFPDVQMVICTAYSDRKSTRLNSSHGYISYAVFCLKKKKDDSRVADEGAAMVHSAEHLSLAH